MPEDTQQEYARLALERAGVVAGDGDLARLRQVLTVQRPRPVPRLDMEPALVQPVRPWTSK